LIVEIDGDYHLTKEQRIEDKKRQNWLEQNGYTVLRFTNNQILFDIDKTIETIKQYFK
jgi:very-short-patch-repair endonuclease